MPEDRRRLAEEGREHGLPGEKRRDAGDAKFAGSTLQRLASALRPETAVERKTAGAVLMAVPVLAGLGFGAWALFRKKAPQREEGGQGHA